MSPGVRIESGRLKNRLPAVRRGRHFRRRETALFHKLYAYFSLQRIVYLSGR